MSIEFTETNGALELIRNNDGEYVIISNPEYIFPEKEIYRLAPKSLLPVDHIEAVLMDMDGTTTTTEELCIHSLEYAVRQISGLEKPRDWAGLDRNEDYPHIIGNSTTKHVEYLISKYGSKAKPDSLKKSFLFAALWTLVYSRDMNRINEVKANIKKFLPQKSADLLLSFETDKKTAHKDVFEKIVKSTTKKLKDKLQIEGKDDVVRATIDIYYQRYHQILHRIKKGEAGKLQKELGLSTGKSLIEPMQGTAVFLPLIKGYFGAEAGKLLEYLMEEYRHKDPAFDGAESIDTYRENLSRIGKHFEDHPSKVAVVTSSISYEAEIVLAQLFSELRNIFESFKISSKRKKIILEKFSSPHNFYDAVITATDSSEIRLKPHRDLYSIALYKIGVPKSGFANVIGLEDSQSGTVAIRAAGVGKSIAVPFAHTQGHNLSGAALIADGGLPEIILKHNLFLKQNI